MIIRLAKRLLAAPFVVRLLGFACFVVLMRWLWFSGRVENGPILCPFRLITGHPCPMCGTTRAVGALCAGDIQAAWNLNPLGTCIAFGGSVILLSPKTLLEIAPRVQGLTSVLTKPAVAGISFASFVGTWVWTVSRW